MEGVSIWAIVGIVVVLLPFLALALEHEAHDDDGYWHSNL